MKHTPGPWHVGKSLRIIGANSQRVAVCDDNEATPGMDNARLIAAAPDLLAALESTVKEIERLRHYTSGMDAQRAYTIAENASAAIAKAKGANT